jgi:catechol 2,3-dioxygenase-like lactoylglutathione lyase family enzyme
MLQHVSLEVRPEQVGECVAFWRLLGFEPVDPPPTLRDRAAWLESGQTQVHLMHVDDPVAPPQGHAAVVAPDYERVLDELRRAGFEPEPRREHWGAPRCFVRDPVGHRVEVMAAPPPSS